MASSEVLGLAKQGDPAAIATLMNQVTCPQGIVVRAKHQDNCLHLLFEGKQIPKQQTAVSFVRSSLNILNLNSLETVMVYGRQQGSHHTSWHESIQLQSCFELSPTAQLTDEGNVERSNAQLTELAELTDLEDDTKTEDLEQIIETEITEIIEPATPKAESPKPETTILETVPPLLQLQVQAEPTPIAPNPMETSSLAQRPETTLTETSEIPEFLQRPEAVVFVFLTTLFVFWDAYLSLLNELAPETSVSCRQLSQRLGVSKSTVRKRKRQAGFSEWSKNLDPEGIAWVYQTGGLYRPID
jgi:hypothetical protein